MTSARRTLLTATAAGTLLGALWFVPSASATVHASARAAAGVPATHITEQGRAASATAKGTTAEAGYQAGFPDQAGSPAQEGSAAQEGSMVAGGTELADTGSIDTTPYVVGGSLFLAVGAGFVVYSVRRERLGF